MSERVWYRSLYWRIALGIIVLLIAVLVAQAIAFAWLVSRSPEALPPRALQQSARALAFELETSLAQDPALDLDGFVQDRVAALSRPIVLLWRDGRVFAAGVDAPPAWLLEATRGRLERGRAGQGPFGGAGGFGGLPGGFPGRRPLGIAPVRTADGIGGLIAVLPGPALRTVLRELGPMLFAVAAALTIGGTAIAALLIFGPAHRRLRGLEAAARELGAGHRVAPVQDTGGDEIATVARSFNDMASEIVRRAEALQASDRVRRQLLADVSHELMTPLTAMRGYLETLRLPDLRLEPASRERYLGIVLEETLRLEHIIGDLLDLSRLEAGGMPLAMTAVRVADLFDRVRSRHERPLQEKGVSLHARVAPGAEVVEGDADRLEQALQNLAANALRHTPAGGVIRLAAEPLGDGRIRLAVSDTGAGITPEHLPFVFDRFFKADAARAGGGSGLGLSIVRAIAEQHGGTVNARSTPGVETVFEIILPRARPG
jgi:signal transduction histidine kinase